jgi:hypothetical protein
LIDAMQANHGAWGIRVIFPAAGASTAPTIGSYAPTRAGISIEPIEVLRTVEPDGISDNKNEIRQSLHQWFGEKTANNFPVIPRLIRKREISMLPLQLGLEGSLGFMIVGCRRLDFPQETERRVMNVAAKRKRMF